MIVRMVHPLHGATHVYDTGELEKLKKLGWSEDVPRQAEQSEPAPAVIERKKPGPKPKAKP